MPRLTELTLAKSFVLAALVAPDAVTASSDNDHSYQGPQQLLEKFRLAIVQKQRAHGQKCNWADNETAPKDLSSEFAFSLSLGSSYF